MSNTLNSDLVAARLRAMDEPNIFHIVGNSAAGVFVKEETVRAVEVSPYEDGVNILFLNPSRWSLGEGADPFRSTPSGSTTAATLDEAFSAVINWGGGRWDADDWNRVVWERNDIDEEAVREYTTRVEASDPPHRIVSLDLLTPAAPTIWRGQTASGDPVYIRYRHGNLRIHVGGVRGDDAEPLVEETLGGTFDSVLERDELFAIEADSVGFSLDLEDVDDMNTLPTQEERFEGAVESAPAVVKAEVEAFAAAMRELHQSLDDVYDVLDENASTPEMEGNELLKRLEYQRSEEDTPWLDACTDVGFIRFSLGLGTAANYINAAVESEEAEIERFNRRLEKAFERLDNAENRDGVPAEMFNGVRTALRQVSNTAERVAEVAT